MNSIQDILNAFRERWKTEVTEDWELEFEELLEEALTEFEREIEQKYQDRVRMMGYVDSNNDIQMLDEKHVKEIVKMVVVELEKEKRT